MIGKKKTLFFPINEKNDWIEDELLDLHDSKCIINIEKPEIIYEVIGKSDQKKYKGTVKKAHKIYTER